MMDLKIINSLFEIELYGFYGTITNGQPAVTGFELMNRVWKTVKENNIPNMGINYWVYGADNKLFAGVELKDGPSDLLEVLFVGMDRFALYRHTGPYNQLGEVHKNILAELERRQLRGGLPYIEKYGHYSDDESKCKTTVMMQLLY